MFQQDQNYLIRNSDRSFELDLVQNHMCTDNVKELGEVIYNVQSESMTEREPET